MKFLWKLLVMFKNIFSVSFLFDISFFLSFFVFFSHLLHLTSWLNATESMTNFVMASSDQWATLIAAIYLDFHVTSPSTSSTRSNAAGSTSQTLLTIKSRENHQTRSSSRSSNRLKVINMVIQLIRSDGWFIESPLNNVHLVICQRYITLMATAKWSKAPLKFVANLVLCFGQMSVLHNDGF